MLKEHEQIDFTHNDNLYIVNIHVGETLKHSSYAINFKAFLY